ncbi:MAG TPA: four helix bundle protein [Ohtaekwangia sp.]
MTKEELKNRNKKFAIEVVRLMRAMPNDRIFDSLVRQVVRSSTSIGANYRAACRGKSSADFLNKLKIVEEETDETIYFLDIINDVEGGKNRNEFERLMKEGNELLSIYVASLKTVRANSNRKS